MYSASWKAELCLDTIQLCQDDGIPRDGAQAQAQAQAPGSSHEATANVPLSLLACCQLHLITQWFFRRDECIDRLCLC